jgi:hypothetical protein
MRPLFLDKLQETVNEFRKESGYIYRLSEVPDNWAQEIGSELYKQLPFLSDYEVNVSIDKKDPGRGFAFGYADVSNKTERPEVEHEEAGIPHIRIPIIAEERQLRPFSVFLDGERVLPMTEERVREALFNPATFDLSNSVPRDPSLVEPLMPPQRSGIGLGGEYKMASIAPKLGSIDSSKNLRSSTISHGSNKTASLLQAIAPTIRESDRDRFVEKVASDPTIRAGFRRSGIAELLIDVMDTKLASESDRLSALADIIEPSVVTLQKLPGGDFIVKSANVNAFVGGDQAAGQVVPFDEVAEAIGRDAAKSLQPGQIATVVSDPVQIDGDDANAVSDVSEFGTYKVQDSNGKQMEGWVFPELLNWDKDFTPQKTRLFLNGNVHSIQDSIVGERVGSSSRIPEDIPKGEGVFRPADGRVATAPITIQYGTTNSQGIHTYVGTDSFGNEIRVSLVPHLKKPQRISDNEFALPKDWGFTRLNKRVKLVSNENAFGLSKKVSKEKTSATLFYNGSFNITGGCGLDKISSDLRYDLDAVGAEFILGLLGVDGVTAKQKVAEARKVGFVKLSGLRTIRTLSERYQQAVKEASAFLHKIPDLRRDLIKEAAAIEDQGTVDKVLALNFINPENLSTFIEYLPELEQTSERMAEMVLAGYLGMKEIPLGAVERSMRNMEEVIQGLKAIQHSHD